MQFQFYLRLDLFPAEIVAAGLMQATLLGQAVVEYLLLRGVFEAQSFK